MKLLEKEGFIFVRQSGSLQIRYKLHVNR
ncbi:hypothetical protein [Ohtaekwangia sp.]